MKYLVVVHPGPAKDKLKMDQQSYMLRPGVKAQFVTARNAKAAADMCDVEPGGKVQVVEETDVETFTRAERAPLVSDRAANVEAAA